MPTTPRQIVPLVMPEAPGGAAVLAPLALPLLSYHGGPVLTAAQVVTIFWGAAWTQPAQSALIPQLNAFFDFILTSSLQDLLAEYSVPGRAIGHGSRAGTATITATEPGGGSGQVSDAQIQAALQGWIAAGTVPAVTANTLYFVYLPPGVISTLGGSQSCQAFCGYHNQIGGNIFYAVEPFLTCPGCTFGNGQALDSLTKVSSHELCEAITDPALNAWFDNTPPGNEIGDICNSTQAQLGGYTIQLEWSNQAGNCRLQPANLPTVSWATPADIVFGTPLGPVQLDGTADEPGGFVYTPGTGAVLNAGLGQTLSVLFTPFNAAHLAVTASVQINVLKATPALNWTAPADIIYGATLGPAQLNATASAAGTFAYTPPAGTLLPVGTHSLCVTFSPADPANYNSATTCVLLTVSKATPAINWSNPPDIVYGTVLGATQLDATASVAGTFAYTPPAGTVLTAGAHTLGLLFTPADNANYNNASASVQLTVLKATPVISWATPADIDFGTALGPAQLNASASVAGSFNYAPPAGTVLGIGLNHNLTALFTPNDSLNYNPATATVLLNVLHGYPVILAVTFSPTWVRAGSNLQVDVTVRNDSVKAHATEGPNPGFVYNEGDTYETKGPPLIAGAYRIGVDLEHSPYAVRDLYRWGFGHTLAPGETLSVRGYIHFNDSNQHSGAYYAAMIEEPNLVIQDRQGTTFITVFGQPD